jgi:hypothetical protein
MDDLQPRPFWVRQSIQSPVEINNRKKKVMIIKPSIQFLNFASDAVLITTIGGILTGMTGNLHYPTTSPALPLVQTALDEFTTSVADAVNGGLVFTATKNAKRAALVALLRQLASYVQVACKGDMTVLLTSGFPIQKPQRSPVGVLPAPGNLTVTLGARSGELNASAAPITGAAIFNWRLTTAAAPSVIVQSAQTTAASNIFDNLTPGVVYNVQANAVGSAGPSDWSDSVSHMVM